MDDKEEKLLNEIRNAADQLAALVNELSRSGYGVRVPFYNASDGEICAATPRLFKRIR